MQGEFGEMQGGRKASQAKSGWISIIWTVASLLPEQGGYDCLAGRFAIQLTEHRQALMSTFVGV